MIHYVLRFYKRTADLSDKIFTYIENAEWPSTSTKILLNIVNFVATLIVFLAPVIGLLYLTISFYWARIAVLVLFALLPVLQSIYKAIKEYKAYCSKKRKIEAVHHALND